MAFCKVMKAYAGFHVHMFPYAYLLILVEKNGHCWRIKCYYASICWNVIGRQNLISTELLSISNHMNILPHPRVLSAKLLTLKLVCMWHRCSSRINSSWAVWTALTHLLLFSGSGEIVSLRYRKWTGKRVVIISICTKVKVNFSQRFLPYLLERSCCWLCSSF